MSRLLYTGGCLLHDDVQGQFLSRLSFYLFDITSQSRPQITLQHLGMVKHSQSIISYEHKYKLILNNWHWL